MRRMSLIDLAQDAPTKAAAVRLPLPANVRKDVFLSALLEMPTTKRTSRNPLEWASAAVLHIAFVAILIVVPLYATGTIHLSKFDEVPLVAPPPPPDERGNVVQAHAVSGHPLLIPPALGAVLQWKYEPSSLNGQPVSVELRVLVVFRPKS